jgi:hypothetical protein
VADDVREVGVQHKGKVSERFWHGFLLSLSGPLRKPGPGG